MPIRPQDIDPILQQSIKDWMAQLFSQTTALDPDTARIRTLSTQKWHRTARRHAGLYWSALVTFIAGMAAVPIIEPLGDGPAVLTLFAGMGLAVALLVRGVVKTNRALMAEIDAGLLRTIAERIARSPAERVYCEAIAALIDAEPVLTEVTQREILTQLNDLLASYRKLDGPVRHFLAAGGNSPVEELERELEGLNTRRDAKVDPRARETMDQSIALCSQRLASARAMGPAREQAEAQQELIVQAISSVQASLSRMVASGSGVVTDNVVVAGVDELHRTVSQVNLQTRAVEEAVNEVVALRL